MIRIARTETYDLWAGRLVRPFLFVPPFEGGAFALLIFIADPEVTDGERVAVSRELVRRGCRYAVCTGHDCSLWDDAIDLAFLATSPDFSPPDERFVMTTWHENESLAEVAHFFRHCTAFEGFTPDRFLVLILGGGEGIEEETCSVVRKEFE